MGYLQPSTLQIRPATLSDVADLAHFANLAGEGLPAHLWSQLAVGDETPYAIGAQRAARDDGSFSWRNARVAMFQGRVVGSVIDYELVEAAMPGPDVPDYLRPLCELELNAVGSRYINILAVSKDMRRRGVGRALIEDVATQTDRDLTLIVRSGNEVASSFYENEGFTQQATRPTGRGGPSHLHGEWHLMRRASVMRPGEEHLAASGLLRRN